MPIMSLSKLGFKAGHTVKQQISIVTECIYPVEINENEMKSVS